jgi:hypothetical protein
MDSLVKESNNYRDHGSELHQASSDEHHDVPQVGERLAEDLSQCHWAKLQQIYSDTMKQHGDAEEELRDRSLKLLEVPCTFLSHGPSL